MFSPAHNRTLKLFTAAARGTPEVASRLAYIEDSVLAMLRPLAAADILLGGGLSISYLLRRLGPNVVGALLGEILGTDSRGIYRDHGSIHILCRRDRLSQLLDIAAQHNYKLHRRSRFMGKVAPMIKWESYSAVDANELLALSHGDAETDYRTKNFRLIAMVGNELPAFQPGDLTQYVDLHVHDLEAPDGHHVSEVEPFRFVGDDTAAEVPYERVTVVSYDDGVRVPLRYFEGCRYVLQPGNLFLKVAHPWYLLEVKMRALRSKNLKDERHATDMEVIEKILQFMEIDADLGAMHRSDL